MLLLPKVAPSRNLGLKDAAPFWGKTIQTDFKTESIGFPRCAVAEPHEMANDSTLNCGETKVLDGGPRSQL